MHKFYCLWFHVLNLPEVFKYTLWKQVLSCQKIYEADDDFYKSIGIDPEKTQKIQASKKDLEDLQNYYESLEHQGITMVTIEDEDYPDRLKVIDDPPIVFFLKGDKTLVNWPSIAIVGARKCTEYGYSVANELGNELGKAGFSVVSGMALGIDEAAHKGALSKGNRTLAVLGCGVDICYPKQNRTLYQALLERGGLLSEFLPGTEPRAYQFPMRNRIISGLSLGTVVVEAAQRSGSLITAHLALAQNREVFAVPGNMNNPLSKGTNKLIQAGAKMVTCVEDIIEELVYQLPVQYDNFENNYTNNPILLLDKVEIMVYDNLSWQPTPLLDVAQKSNMSEHQIEKILLKLEIKGFITRLPGRRYVRLN